MAARPVDHDCMGTAPSPAIAGPRMTDVRPAPTDDTPPIPMNSLRPEVARAVLDRLLAVRPELGDLARRLAESVIAVLEDDPRPSPPPVTAPSTPDTTTGS
jgi:hypothetical protein